MEDRDIGWSFFEKIIKKTMANGEAWAEAKSQSLFLEETKKSVFSDIMNTISREKGAAGEKITEGALERLAYAHPDYKAHVKALSEAKKTEAKLYVQYQAGQNAFEAARTCASLEKKRMQIG